jgi:hypothetical protein
VDNDDRLRPVVGRLISLPKARLIAALSRVLAGFHNLGACYFRQKRNRRARSNVSLTWKGMQLSFAGHSPHLVSIQVKMIGRAIAVAFTKFHHESRQRAPRGASVSGPNGRNAEEDDESQQRAVIVLRFEACRSIHLSYGRTSEVSISVAGLCRLPPLCRGEETVALSSPRSPQVHDETIHWHPERHVPSRSSALPVPLDAGDAPGAAYLRRSGRRAAHLATAPISHSAGHSPTNASAFFSVRSERYIPTERRFGRRPQRKKC